MAIPAFPIPEEKPTLAQVDSRLQLQDDVLGGLYATAQAAVDERINSQAAVLGSLANTAVKVVDRRVRSQSKLLEPVIGTAIQTVDDAIARQGAQLAIHSEVFPRTYPAQSDTPSSRGPAYAPLSPAPLSTAALNGTTPSSAAPGFTPGNGGGATYAIVCDCGARSLSVFNLSDSYYRSKIALGKFVPIRYGANDRILFDFLNLDLGRPRPTEANIVAVACHAFDNDGDGWPYNGDFYPEIPGEPNHGQGLPAVGQPVGNWPFPR